MGLYTEPIKMWHKKLSYDKTRSGIKKLFAEDYHYLHELQRTNATQSGFHGENMATKIQENFSEALKNLAMAIISENIYSPRLPVT